MRQKRRETQALLATLGYTFRSPSLLALELLWRWAYGVPVLLWAWRAVQPILALVPLEWMAEAQAAAANPVRDLQKLTQVAALVWPSLVQLALRSAPWLLLGWVAMATLGRVLVTMRLRALQPAWRLRLTPGVVARVFALQLARFLLLVGAFWLFVRIAAWAAADAFPANAQPNLVLYFSEVIICGLLIFAAWGAASYVVSVAPAVAIASPELGLAGVLRRSGRLRGVVEINLVLGIVKLALIVLAMVFSAVPIPFEAEVPLEQLHLWWALVTIWYLAASDFFHVARFVEMLRLSVAAIEAERPIP